MKEIEFLFFQFIQLAVGQRKGLMRQPSDKEWEELFDLSKKHGVVGVLYDAAEAVVRQFSISPLPRCVIKWYYACQKIQELNESFVDVCHRVDAFFHKKGFEGTILKGQGLALLYDKPKCRSCGDIDYWIYRCVDVDSRTVTTEVSGIIRNVLRHANRISHDDHHVCYHHCDFGQMGHVGVEVHWRPSWMYNPITNRRFQKWARAQVVEFRHSSELDLTLPSQGFNLVFVLLHIYRHLFYEGIGLKQVMDYYYVLRRNCNEQERQEALRIIRGLHLMAFARALMWMLREVFGAPREMLLCEPCERDGRFLLNEIMIGGAFGKSDTRLLRKQNESQLHHSARKVMHNFCFLRFDPMEVICTPFWRLWHWWWRRKYKFAR
ncbi:MAG: nucleotidyltransferase family protein [Bacteroidales bacterium]|nr:nucleotidyltransferase family protein [Bacteroidales bacterium]